MKKKLAISALLVIALLATAVFAEVAITDTRSGRTVWAYSIWDALRAWFGSGGITGAQVAPPPSGLPETDTSHGCTSSQQCCSDNIDNDGNGLTDAADPACARLALFNIVYIPVKSYQGKSKSGSGGTPSSPPPAPGPGPNGGNGGNGNGGGGGAPNGPGPNGGPGGPPAGPVPPNAPGNGGGLRGNPVGGGVGGGCNPLGPFMPGGFGGGIGGGTLGGGTLGGEAIGLPVETQWNCFYDNGQQFFGVEGGISFEQIILPNGKVVAQLEFIVNEAGAQFLDSILGPNGELVFTIPGDGATIAWIIPVSVLDLHRTSETDFTTVTMLSEEI